jgi:hypothetical protein
MKKKSKGVLIHKLHQLQKRIKRSLDNKGHTSDLKMKIRLKRVKKLQNQIRKNKEK